MSLIIQDNTKATLETGTPEVDIEYDETVVPAASYFPIYTVDGRIPQILGRNIQSGGADVYETGATFSDSTESFTYNGNTTTLSLLDITHS